MFRRKTFSNRELKKYGQAHAYLFDRASQFGASFGYVGMFAHGGDVYIGIYPDGIGSRNFQKTYGPFCLQDLFSVSDLIIDIISEKEAKENCIDKKQFDAEADKFIGDLTDRVRQYVPNGMDRLGLMVTVAGMTEDIKHRLFDD